MVRHFWELVLGFARELKVNEPNGGLSALMQLFRRPFLLMIWEDFLWLILGAVWGRRDVQVNLAIGRFALDTGDPGISKELFLYQMHEPLTTELIGEVLREGMVVVDVGSNIGYYVIIEKDLVGPEGMVVAIEPSPSNVRRLRRNIAINGLTGVVVKAGAVGAHDGSGVLNLSHCSNCNTMLDVPHPTAGAVEVEEFQLDTLVESLGLERVDVVRMDIEGYEVVALQGMRNLLREHKPWLIMELHPVTVGAEPIIEMLQVLATMGYQVEFVFDRPSDYPWMKPKKESCLKPLNIQQLMHDEGMTSERCAITVFLRPGPTAG